MDPIPVFVGSDIRMRETGAEQVLEYSIRKNTQRAVEVTCMTALGPDERFSGYVSQPHEPYPRDGGELPSWATHFTGFRWLVPYLCDYQGFAIYLDADMLVLGDIGELFDLREKGASLVVHGPDVMVIDCRIRGPTVEWMKRTHTNMADWTETFNVKRALPREWDHYDKVTPESKLVHYTNMETQPWQPWPDRFSYPQHPNEEAFSLWWKYHDECFGDGEEADA